MNSLWSESLIPWWENYTIFNTKVQHVVYCTAHINSLCILLLLKVNGLLYKNSAMFCITLLVASFICFSTSGWLSIHELDGSRSEKACKSIRNWHALAAASLQPPPLSLKKTLSKYSNDGKNMVWNLDNDYANTSKEKKRFYDFFFHFSGKSQQHDHQQLGFAVYPCTGSLPCGFRFYRCCLFSHFAQVVYVLPPQKTINSVVAIPRNNAFVFIIFFFVVSCLLPIT